MLPNFLVIGAQRAGTTTIWHALDRHPDIFMSPTRETAFFSNDHNFNRGPAFYETTFFHEWNGEAACGEKTPEYLLMPYAAARIRDVLGETVKLIALVRNPAERAHSGYRHSLMLGCEHLSFREALDAEPERIARNPAALGRFGYQARSRYAPQLARYYDLFPRENILVIFFDDLIANQNAVFDRVYQFLGVAPVPPGTPVEEGKARIGRAQVDPATNTVRFKGRTIRNPSPALLRFAEEYDRAVGMLAPLSPEEVVKINRTRFREDIEALSRLTGRDLGAWLGEKPAVHVRPAPEGLAEPWRG